MAAGKLPQTSDAQDIGDRARTSLFARRPQSSKGIYWRLTSLEGTEDFGLDFHVHTAVNQQVTDTFRLQLKGTGSPETDVNDTHITVSFETSTLRLYARIPEPVLIVVCDLSAAAEPAQCPLYFVWAYEELQRIGLDTLPDHQKKATVHVPKANQLTSTLDVGPYVQHYLEVVAAGRALDVGVAQAKPALGERERMELIRGVEKGLAGRSPALLDALAEPPDGVWVDPARGTAAWHLRKAQELLRNGKVERAATELQAAQPVIVTASATEAATYWSLHGKTLTIEGRHAEARAAFQQAKDLHPIAKHLASWAESEMRARLSGDTTASLQDVEAALQADDPETKSARARVIAAQGRYDDAIALLDSFSGAESLGARAVICMMQDNPALTLAASEQGLLEVDSADPLRTLFLLLRARSRFMLATGRAVAEYDGDYVPPSGVRGLDLPMLKQAWNEILEVVEIMDDTGWPSNGEFVADVWASTASMLAKQRETLPALAAAAKARPYLLSLQSATEAMAAQLGEYGQALEANARLPDSDIKHLRRIIFFHQLGRHTDCVEYAEAHLAHLERKHEHFGPAVSLAALSAQKILRVASVDAWVELLGSDPALAPDKAVLEYMLAKATNRLETSAALATLEQRYEDLGRPMGIALALFEQFDPTDAQQALRSVQVAERIQQDMVLPISGAVQFGAALATLKRWDDLLRFAQSYRDQFDPHARLSAFEALALDRLGRTPEARTVLEGMLAAGMTDPMALNIYVNIMVRCGFVDEARGAAERILEVARSKREKLACVRLLFNLEQNANPKSPRLLALAEQLGELVDRNDEAEEGVFLGMVLIGTSIAGVSPTPEQLARFRERSAAFFAKWPDSKIIRQAQVPDDASPEEFLAMLNKLVGENEEREKFRRKLENQLQAGSMPIPFAWRPRLALSNVHDVVHLWEIAKESHADDRKHHLVMAGADWQPVPAKRLKEQMPLLDMTALLVLDDLGLIDRLFDLFPKVAIAQATLEQLHSLAQVFSGSVASWRCVQLRDKLKPHVDRIVQPAAEVPDSENRPGDDNAEIAALSRTGKYCLYSDDLIFRIYAGQGKPIDSMCTCDVLCALEEAGLLDVGQVAQKYALLCRWHVGLAIPVRYQLAALPAALSKARSVAEGIDVIKADPASHAIAQSLWDYRGDVKYQLGHVGGIVHALVQQEDLPLTTIAAYVGVWFLKARLRTDVNWTAQQLLAGIPSIVAAAAPPLNEKAVHKLWQVYRELVAFHFGDRMDEAKEREATAVLGEYAARADAKRSSSTLRDRLASGLTEGTAEREWFEVAYSDQRIRLSVEANSAKQA